MKKERIEVYATLIRKETFDFYVSPKIDPAQQHGFSLIFKSDEGEKSFEVSIFEFNVVEEGDCGQLIYEGNTIIRFADKIIDFKM